MSKKDKEQPMLNSEIKGVPPFDASMNYKKGDKVLIEGVVVTINGDTESSEPPLLPSERKELLQRIKDAENRADTIFGAVTRKHNGIIVRAKYLTTEQKEQLLADILAS